MKKFTLVRDKNFRVIKEKCPYCDTLFQPGLHQIEQCLTYEASLEIKESENKKEIQTEKKREKAALSGSKDYQEFRAREYYQIPDASYREAISDFLMSQEEASLPPSCLTLKADIIAIKEKYPKPKKKK